MQVEQMTPLEKIRYKLWLDNAKVIADVYKNNPYTSAHNVITPGKWDTIALIGMAPSVRRYLDQIPADAGHFSIGPAWGLPGLRRIDALIEIHPRWILEHPNYAPGLLRFLKHERDYPLFTAEPEPDFPGSVKYPLEYICQRYLPHVRRGDTMLTYFVSSFDYLMALALLYEPKRIEVYGFDMASDTEYRFQREGAAWWLGYAAGLGIETWIPPDSPIMSEVMYAYEGTRYVRYERVAELDAPLRAGLERYEAEFRKLKQSAQQNGEARTPEGIAVQTQLGTLRDFYFLHSGALQVVEQLLKDFSYGDIISRQELERQRALISIDILKHTSRLNWYEGIVRDRKVRYDENADTPQNAAIFLNELNEAADAHAKVRDEYFVHNGALQMIAYLMGECDLDDMGEFELTLNIIEHDVAEETRTGV